MGPKRRRKVTGLVIGNGKAGIGRQEERRIRASIYSLIVKAETENVPSSVLSNLLVN